jgi:integrase
MTSAQFEAIYTEAPDWIQIAMDLILQTALRQQDIWRMKWRDIQEDYLYVIPEKSKSILRKEQIPSYLRFNLRKNTKLANTIARAHTLKASTKTEDCPYIIFRTNAKRTKTGITKAHPLQITRTYAAHEFKKTRDKAIANTTAFDGLKPEEMPAFHGIRKLSLQQMRASGVRSLPKSLGGPPGLQTNERKIPNNQHPGMGGL